MSDMEEGYRAGIILEFIPPDAKKSVAWKTGYDIGKAEYSKGRIEAGEGAKWDERQTDGWKNGWNTFHERFTTTLDQLEFF